jgi:hypothetical protein
VLADGIGAADEKRDFGTSRPGSFKVMLHYLSARAEVVGLSARAASGHAAAAPPMMKSRRFMSDMGFLLTPCSRLPAPSA